MSDFPEKCIFLRRLRFNVISVTRGWGEGVEFPEKKCYVTLEWPLYSDEVTLVKHFSSEIHVRLSTGGRHRNIRR